MQDLIKEKISKLCEILKAHQNAETPINMSRAYRAMTMDIITEYVMTSSFDYLDRKDFGGRWYTMIRNGSASQVLMNQFRWIMPIMVALPYKLAITLVPDAEAALGVQKVRTIPHTVHLRHRTLAKEDGTNNQMFLSERRTTVSGCIRRLTIFSR